MAVRELNPKLKLVAQNELNEDPKRLQDGLDHLKEWLKKQPHINSRTDDQFLVAFLRGSKYSLERAKEKLDMYHTMKTISPELFANRDPLLPDLQKLMTLGVNLPLPKLDKEDGPRYALIRSGLIDIGEVHQSNLFKLATMIQDINMLEDDNFTVVGGVAVQDMTGINMKYSMSLSPALVKKTMTCIQQGYPNRIKGVHFFNLSPAFEIIHKLFRPLLSAKLQKRMSIYSSTEEMLKNIPKSVLPEEYGGDGGKIDDIIAHWKAKIESYREWFLEDEKYKTNEQKRSGQPKTSENVFGIEGSFRRLDVD